MTTRKISTTIALTLLTFASSTSAIASETVTETVQGTVCAIISQPSKDVQPCESVGKIGVNGNITIYMFIKQDKSMLAFVTNNAKTETTSKGVVRLPVELLLEGDGSKSREVSGFCTRSEIIPGTKMACAISNSDESTITAVIK